MSSSSHPMHIVDLTHTERNEEARGAAAVTLQWIGDHINVEADTSNIDFAEEMKNPIFTCSTGDFREIVVLLYNQYHMYHQQLDPIPSEQRVKHCSFLTALAAKLISDGVEKSEFVSSTFPQKYPSTQRPIGEPNIYVFAFRREILRVLKTIGENLKNTSVLNTDNVFPLADVENEFKGLSAVCSLTTYEAFSPLDPSNSWKYGDVAYARKGAFTMLGDRLKPKGGLNKISPKCVKEIDEEQRSSEQKRVFEMSEDDKKALENVLSEVIYICA
jgi:hypothetical protein